MPKKQKPANEFNPVDLSAYRNYDEPAKIYDLKVYEDTKEKSSPPEVDKEQSPIYIPTDSEVYQSYYWLITDCDPYQGLICAGYLSPPQCFGFFMKECGEGKDLFYTIDKLFKWHLYRAIPILHTRDWSPITSIVDVKRLWKDVGVELIKTRHTTIGATPEARSLWQEFDRASKDDPEYSKTYTRLMLETQRLKYDALSAYLLSEHNKNREELSLAVAGKGEGEKTVPEAEEMSIKTVNETLFYDTTKGTFTFGKIESEPISKSSKSRVRTIAEKFLKYWKTGNPCPKSKITEKEKIPQGVCNDNSTIRQVLKSIGVDMPSPTTEGFPPPTEPQSFAVITQKTE